MSDSPEIKYMGWHPASADEQRDLPCDEGSVVFEWSVPTTNWFVKIPFPQESLDQHGEQSILDESWPRVRQALTQIDRDRA